MFNLAEGIVVAILESDEAVTKTVVSAGQQIYQALSFHMFTGTPALGDQVLVNTTAFDLSLGSGGHHFLYYNKTQGQALPLPGQGHIMKLRYTPLQFAALSAEEKESPHHSILKDAKSLAGTPVVIGLLHSHLVPIILGLNENHPNKVRIAYLMTDGGALPLAYSQQVALLKKQKLLTGTVTIGHAFGGDLEAVNVYSGLLAAKMVLKSDVIVVTMGPGIVGTNTKFGFSGIEQGMIANAVASLGGKPVVVPRISFADSRSRHRGLSHHSVTILSQVTLAKTWVGLPQMSPQKERLVEQQINAAGLAGKHSFVIKNGELLLAALLARGIELKSMGRRYQDDPEFFQAAWASGLVARDLGQF